MDIHKVKKMVTITSHGMDTFYEVDATKTYTSIGYHDS